MSVNSILKKEGISIIRKLDILEVNRIAKNIANKIGNYFSEYLLNYDDLFASISRIDMYLAKMPLDSDVAKYLYVNNSIYFNENVDLSVSENSIFALHECIHFIQAQVNANGKLVKLGLCEDGVSGISINEAAVQFMASTAQGLTSDNVRYYDININTISLDCYPIQCALLGEMVYFTGAYALYHSTLNSNNVFKNTFISLSDKKTYNKIELNFDKLLKLEDDLYYFTVELKNASKQRDYKLLNRLISNRKSAIRKVFLDTQNLIIQSCFTNLFNSISSLEDVKEFKNKLYNFKNVLGYTDDYNFYNEFYYNSMIALDSIRELLKVNGDIVEYRNENKSLAIVKNSNGIASLFAKIIQKIGKLFSINKRSAEKINN